MARGDYDAYIDTRTGEIVTGSFVRSEIVRGVPAKYFIHAHPQTAVERKRKKKYQEENKA